jgi:transposase
MYIDRVPNRKSPPAILLRESVRVGDKIVKRTLANLSSLPEEAIEAVRVILKGGHLSEPGESFQVESSRPCGHVQAIKLVMDRLGMASILGGKDCPEYNIALALIAQRILQPSSKLASSQSFENTTLAEEFGVAGVDENGLYQAMDWLVEHQGQIEKNLAKLHLDEGATVFYDVSCSSYYGEHCPLAARGYNRDGLKLPSIVYGLLTDQEGRPISVQVYPGNTADPVTVPDQIENLRNRFGVGRFVIVGDRGMLTQTQIDKLKENSGCGWISCLRSNDIRKILDSNDSEQAPLFNQKNLAEITHPDFPNERLIVCYNPILAMDRARTRQELLDLTEKQLQQIAQSVAKHPKISAASIGIKVGKVINKYKMAKHFKLTIGDASLQWERKEEAIKREAQLDGLYVIRTSESKEQLSAEDAVRTYKSLGNVEKAFRTFKGLDLRVRPIYHRLENRVRAHIFLCMLAYYVEWNMRQALASMMYADEDLVQNRAQRDPVLKVEPSAKIRQKQTTHQTEEGLTLRNWRGILETLSTVVQNKCRIGEGETAVYFNKETELDESQKEIFRLLCAEAPHWAGKPVPSKWKAKLRPILDSIS